MNYECVYRTAPATPGLSNIIYFHRKITEKKICHKALKKGSFLVIWSYARFVVLNSFQQISYMCLGLGPIFVFLLYLFCMTQACLYSFVHNFWFSRTLCSKFDCSVLYFTFCTPVFVDHSFVLPSCVLHIMSLINFMLQILGEN